MSEEFVILVDKDDNPIGTEEKVRCHMPDGLLHRAFTALLFDGDCRLVLGRRAGTKMLWPGYWDGTFASHPRTTETYVSSGQRRMPEELGVEASLDYMHKFEYHVPYRDVGSENEICATLIGVIDDAGKLAGAEGEIDKVRAVPADALFSEIELDPGRYCPWMLIALDLLDRSDAAALERHAGVLSGWMGKRAHDTLDRAISAHMPDDKWRLLHEA